MCRCHYSHVGMRRDHRKASIVYPKAKVPSYFNNINLEFQYMLSPSQSHVCILDNHPSLSIFGLFTALIGGYEQDEMLSDLKLIEFRSEGQNMIWYNHISCNRTSLRVKNCRYCRVSVLCVCIYMYLKT